MESTEGLGAYRSGTDLYSDLNNTGSELVGLVRHSFWLHNI